MHDERENNRAAQFFLGYARSSKKEARLPARGPHFLAGHLALPERAARVRYAELVTKLLPFQP